MELEEAALTGESDASPKNVETITTAEALLGDRHNMAYMNTAVTRGRADLILRKGPDHSVKWVRFRKA